MQPIIDSHCHLDDKRFSEDPDAVIRRAGEAGVGLFIVPSVRSSGWPRLKQLAQRFPNVRPAYGLHPWFCHLHSEGDIEVLSELLQDAVAVGECGLDFGKGRAAEEEQLKWFRLQLELAVELDKPVILHAYKTIDIVHGELKRYPGVRGVVHGFSGSAQQAESLLDHGHYLGIGNGVTYPQAVKLREIIRNIPGERLLLESDAPDQPPFAHRGERNEPAYVADLARQVAGIRGVEMGELIDRCNNNAKELFHL